jgi:Domain of unknown function (DUF4268)
MAIPNLGRLQRVELRSAWTSEASDFTPWLAQSENLALLGKAIDIELELDSREKGVGPFRADILCKDTMSDGWVLIENQLERTDHSHLGQLITYAAGLDAFTMVWIAERFTDEHRAALDWLNERTDTTINLFGLEIELWQIGDSAIAPKFNMVCQPNGWSKTIQRAAAAGGESSDLEQLRLRFWTAFRDYMESSKSFVKCQKPSIKHWTSHAIGRTGAHLNSIVSTWDPISNERGPGVRAELYLSGPNAKREFDVLQIDKDAIERNLGFPLVWRNPENKAMCRIYSRLDGDFADEQQWPTQFQWLRERLEAMHRVFAPRVKTLKMEMRDQEGD